MHKIRIPFALKQKSILAIALVIVYCLSADLIHHKWTQAEGPGRGVINNDIIYYYGFLPATIIHGDPMLGFLDEPGFINDRKYGFITLENGNRLIQVSIGMSLLYAPFFLTAHLLAPLLGQAPDGFSSIYQLFLVISSLFYLTIGLIFLRKILLRYFTDVVTAITIVVLVLGTNLLYYTVYEGPMSHSYNFALISVFIFLLVRWYEENTIRLSILLGFIMGLIILVRHSNLFIIILFLLWGVADGASLRNRMIFLLRRVPLLFIMIMAFLVPWIPQVIYWKVVTGQFLYNSYSLIGSSFYFSAPQIPDLLFSFRKGWFVYTPVMLLAMSGFIWLYRDRRNLFYVSLVYILVMVYILGSWWSWWYGGSFGSRGFIDTYAIMALPLAAIIDYFFITRSRWIALSVSCFMGMVVLLNLFQTIQYRKGAIHYVSMNREAYFHDFFKINNRNHWPYLSEPDYLLARQGIYYYYGWSENYDAIREMDEIMAIEKIREDISVDRKLVRSIKRYARRNDLNLSEGIDYVVDRVYQMKLQRKNL